MGDDLVGTVMVTGATSGLGRAFVTELARAGWPARPARALAQAYDPAFQEALRTASDRLLAARPTP
jgi:NAD(P)-dependent dehydrogenase (short-subunit alcohol dehydrogenase family)